MTMLQHAILVLLLPLASAAFIALLLRRAGSAAAFVSTATAAAIATIALILAIHGDRFESAIEWLRLGDFRLSLGIKFDDLAALMLCIVGVVGLCVHVFSLGYMAEDTAKARYFGGLSIFMFSMIGIVLADNLFMIFIFWELVGFSSWVLINHFCEKQSASDAAKKAFIVNRVGDFGFLLGIVMCWWLNGTVNLTALGHDHVYSRLIPLLLFCGAVGKSAQLPLQVWLPDAMEGPTPVSALIHAATMVAAGIYMLCRIEPLMVPDALTVIMWVGTATALYAALCAIVQRDIKKVLAYSTLSQLGYMVAAFGLGSSGAAMFHLTTHAFFKALLFLGSGAVIYGCHHEQDIFKMGGQRKKMPWTFWTFTIGVAAIIGMPGLAGFFSKDAILHLALEKNHAVFGLLALTAVLTSFYMVRMWKLVFLGDPRSEDASHAHEGGLTLTAPLVLLAALSVVGGYVGIYGGRFDGVFSHIPHAEGSTILFVSLAVMTVGAVSALLLYQSGPVDSLATKAPAVFLGLHFVKESFDGAYNWYVAKIQQRFALLLAALDDLLIAGVVVRGSAAVAGLFGLGARALHTGSLHTYVWWFLGGAAALWALAAGWFN
ncbi:MAG: NADH-quinone oxidoreductase subunit L [Verrucomicrobiota bacterium]